jgi:hypothetical protein
MAGNLPVPLGVEVKIVWNWNGQAAALNILHFEKDAGAVITSATAQAIDTAIKSQFTTSGLAGIFHTGVGLARAETRDMSSNDNPWFPGTGAAVAGTSAANPLPAATSFVVSLPTGKRGRSFNGRVYLWGYTEDANDAAGGIAAAASTASVAFIAGIRSTLAGGSTLLDMAVLSRWTTPPGAADSIERNPPIITPVGAVVAKDARWDVQRRRAVAGV